MAKLCAIEYYLPERIETNDDLAREFPEWRMDKIGKKTGIYQRHCAAPDECASDFAVYAAEKLFSSGVCRPEDVDYVLFCTQTPDYILPTTACLIQHRLGVRKSAGALDFNLGCSGYIYGLSLAKGLIESGQCRNVLLLTADTYTKLIKPSDRSVRCLFGDAGAASWITADGQGLEIGSFVFGTDGSGADNLIAEASGFRHSSDFTQSCELSMNGPEIFKFALDTVPQCVRDLLDQEGVAQDSIDLFVPHQANAHMLEYLRDKMGVTPNKFLVNMQNCGNTVSASIPIALRQSGRFIGSSQSIPEKIIPIGFGVGYSWGACFLS